MIYRRFAFLLALVLFTSFLTARAQDRWTQVKSPNFFLIGNASDKDIRKTATRLEQFREAFRLLFPGVNLTASVPTNVVVFKNDAAYKPFKPKRANGKIDDEIAGYFQPGEDVNYITLAADDDSLGVIFHEYVHFIIDTNFGKTEVPQWFNEGLAEYYQTFVVIDDKKVRLGLPQDGHLGLLQRGQLIPLDQMLAVTNYQLHQSGGHSRSIYYAQSWAMVHYLIAGGRTDSLGAYLSAVGRGVDQKRAFEEAFRMSYSKMESEIKNYVSKGSYRYFEAEMKQKMDFSASMQSSPLTPADTNAYLGDLLYHNNRWDDAEPYLIDAIKAQSDLTLANTALGMVKLRQRKYPEAREYLEKATSSGVANVRAHYQYAYLLSLEGRDELGFVNGFSTETASKIRAALAKAISLDPGFSETYDLFALVALVTNEHLDQAVNHLKTAIKQQPGNQRYSIRLAEVYARQKNFDAAIPIAEKIAQNGENDSMKARSSGLLNQIRNQQEFERQQAENKKSFEAAMAASGGQPRLVKRIEGVPRPSDEELKKLQEEERIRSMNEALRTPLEGETRILGRIEKVDCKPRPPVLTIRTEAESIAISTKDFASLILVSIDPAATEASVGCNADLKALQAMITYKPTSAPKLGIRGELVAVEFVPKDFRLMTEAEMKAESKLVVWDLEDRKIVRDDSGPPLPSAEEIERRRREAFVEGIRNALRKPAAGEKQFMGFLDKLECTERVSLMHFRSGQRIVKLAVSPTPPPQLVMYVTDMAGTEINCSMKPIEYPVVVTFADKPDAKLKSDGTVVAVEFVPQIFTLAPSQQ